MVSTTALGTPSLLDALDAAGVRLTGPRRAVAGLIDAHPGHFTAAEIVAAGDALALGIGRATVFRTLDLLEGIGRLERLDLPDGGHAYVACEPAHHHHAVCEGCGATIAVDDHALTDAVSEIERHTGWSIDAHRLELYGRCPGCAGGTGSAAGRADRKSTRLNSSHSQQSRMPSSA